MLNFFTQVGCKLNKSPVLGVLIQTAMLCNTAAAQGTVPQSSATEVATDDAMNRPPINQPWMIPFNSHTANGFRALDLPPPGRLPQTNANGLTPSLPANDIQGIPSTVTSNDFRHNIQLPDARQLRPRAPTAAGESVSGSQPILTDRSDFPPIPDLNTLSKSPASIGLGLNPGLQQGNDRVTNSGSLVSFQSQPTRPPDPVARDFRASHLVAIVGIERVLAGDLAAMVEPIIHENRAKISSKLQEEEVRQSLTRQALPQYIELKAMSQEFFRDMAGNVPPSELKKMQEQVSTRASRMFYERYVPLELFKRYKVEDLSGLDEKLRETNLSVAILRNYFLTQALSAQLEEKYVPETYEIPPTEIMEYYQENIQKWQIPARAKWRQLTVRFDRFGSEAESQSRIMEMGNEVVLGGKSFDAVARDSSQGFTSQAGGMHDWTFEGSLKSPELNQAIFSLPLNRLSNIIRDDVGLHIIEVLQRESARTKDMAEIQTEIRATLSKERRQKEAEQFREKVLGRVVVWTRWPEDIPGSRPLSEALGEPTQ